ncbi:hypothetical protein Vadar_032086 [Vaccinium darrowii]|uniref:Uncharacterized protein n=1 Tax=Vaccinium darrowii TaxID=229202 RepID=A0ACB7XLS9_9ERIC|nr:hypothetical protein Vadar_032086 [Vaccinium darrowii]
MLAQFPSGRCEPIEDNLREEGTTTVTATTDEVWWTLTFDGATANGHGGAGIVLRSNKGKVQYVAYKLDFECPNNEAEYEALILGVMAAERWGTKRLDIVGDSKLIVKQATGCYTLKELALAPYRTVVQRLLDKFEEVNMIHRPWTENRFPDALATLGAKVVVSEKRFLISITKRIGPTVLDGDYNEDLDQDWCTLIERQLHTKEGSLPLLVLSQYCFACGDLYYRGTQGWLSRCLGPTEAAKRLKKVHDRTCGEGEIAFYRRVQCQGYYWPEMAADTAKLQKSCHRCSLTEVELECNFIDAPEDWRQMYVDYLKESVLPMNRRDAERREHTFTSMVFTYRARRFFLDQDQLYRRTLEGIPLKCLGS